MKNTIKKEFYNKIARSGGVLDHGAYRYWIESPTEVKRIRREYLDTTAALDKTNWVIMAVK